MSSLAVTTTVPGVPVDPELAMKVKRAAMRHEFWRVERDRLIVAASLAGASTREIASLVGLSHVGVSKIINRALDPLRDPVREKDETEKEKHMRELRLLYPEAFSQDDDDTTPTS